MLQNALGLSLVPMGDAGWSDCGTPRRLLECLRGTPAYTTLKARLRKAPRVLGGHEVPPAAADDREPVPKRLQN